MYEPSEQYPGGRKLAARSDIRQDMVTDLTRYPVLLDTFESAHVVKINISEFGLFDHFAVEPPFELHHQKQHLVIRSPRKEDLASV
jgi:hypothetical protein